MLDVLGKTNDCPRLTCFASFGTWSSCLRECKSRFRIHYISIILNNNVCKKKATMQTFSKQQNKKKYGNYGNSYLNTLYEFNTMYLIINSIIINSIAYMVILLKRYLLWHTQNKPYIIFKIIKPYVSYWMSINHIRKKKKRFIR